MGTYKFNTFGFNFDDLGKAVDEFIDNIKVNDVFGGDFTRSTPAINATEYDNFLELQVAAPGLSKDVFELHVENDMLTIAANGTAKAVDEHAKIKRKEFDYARFKRTFKLSNEFNYQAIKASYEQGVLTIVIPKKEATESSKIKVDIA